MKIIKIYFTGKFLDGDNEYMEEYKGFRGDILVEDDNGYFYALGFNSVDSIALSIGQYEDTYYEFSDVYWGRNKKMKLVINPDILHYWIIVEIVNVKVIFKTIKKLELTNFFGFSKSMPTPTEEERKEWTIIKFENYEVSDFYLKLYPSKNEKDKL